MKNCIPMWLALALLAGCASQPERDQDGYPENPPDVEEIPDAVPKPEPRSKYGNAASYKVLGKTYKTLDSSKGFVERGGASFYGTKFHGRRTSSGETYDMYAMTAAHKHLPLPTYVEVTNLDNGSRVVVKVNDRGPFHSKRIIDLSYAAAVKLDIAARGTGRVEIRAIDPGSAATASRATDTEDAHFVQAGAFSSRKNAEGLEQRLWVEYGHNVSIRQWHSGNKSLYRVYLGPYASRAEAANMSSRLREAGISGAHTVID